MKSLAIVGAAVIALVQGGRHPYFDLDPFNAPIIHPGDPITTSDFGRHELERAHNKFEKEYKYKKIKHLKLDSDGSARVAFSDAAEYWGMGTPPWELVQTIKDRCTTAEEYCLEQYNVTTTVRRMENSAPVEGNVTIAMIGKLHSRSFVGGRDQLVDVLAEALRGYHDVFKTEFVPYAHKNKDGEIETITYEPVYFGPKMIGVKLGFEGLAKRTGPNMFVHVHNYDNAEHVGGICEDLKRRGRDISNLPLFRHGKGVISGLGQLNCLVKDD